MELKDMGYNQFIDYATGRALIEIGQGEKFRSVIWSVSQQTLLWKSEMEKAYLEKARKEREKKRKKVKVKND